MPPSRQVTYRQVRDYTAHMQELMEGDPGQDIPSYNQVRDNVANTRTELTNAAGLLSQLENKQQTQMSGLQSQIDNIQQGLTGSLDPVLQRADKQLQTLDDQIQDLKKQSNDALQSVQAYLTQAKQESDQLKKDVSLLLPALQGKFTDIDAKVAELNRAVDLQSS